MAPDARGGDRGAHRTTPLGDRRRGLAVDVGDAETSADAELLEAERREERAEDLGGLRRASPRRRPGCRCGRAARRARRRSSARSARAASPRPRRRSRRRTSCPPGRFARTRGCAPRRPGSRAAGSAGGPCARRVRRRAGRGRPAPSTTTRPTPALEGRARARRSDLLLPCSTSRPGGHPGAQRAVQLAGGRDVDAEPRGVGQPCHRPAQEGLGRVGDAVVERCARLARTSPRAAPRRRRTAACRTPRRARAGRTRRRTADRPRRRPRCPAGATAATGAVDGPANTLVTLRPSSCGPLRREGPPLADRIRSRRTEGVRRDGALDSIHWPP